MYQYSRYFGYSNYSEDKLEKELDSFFELDVPYVCDAIRRNGGICFHELMKEYGDYEKHYQSLTQ